MKTKSILLLGLLVLVPAMTCGAAPLQTDPWTKTSEGHKGHSAGAVWVKAPDLGKWLLVGTSVQAFDPGNGQWESVSDAKPRKKGGITPFYKGVYVPDTKSIYCLSVIKLWGRNSGETSLFTFNCAEKKWGEQKPAELRHLSFPAMAYDPVGKRLVVVGSDKRVENLGWTRTVLCDVNTGKWTDLPLPEDAIVKTHKELVAATERTIDLGGRIRSAWYRDPACKGTSEERDACEKLLVEVQGMPGSKPITAQLKQAAGLIRSQDMLKALKAVRTAQRKLEDAAFDQYPVPRSRRNAPLVYDAKNKVFMLFGGDHEDYHMNDTWVLDLARSSWKRVGPAVAPSPRAGHAVCYLPGSGRIALYGGYIRHTHMSYGCKPSAPIDPRQLWTYDVAENRWELAGAWPAKNGAASPSVGGFFGYTRDYYNPPLMLADEKDNLLVAQSGSKKNKSITWRLALGAAPADAAGTTKYGKSPNTRFYKTGNWVASYGETNNPPVATGLDKLPANKWVRLPKPPRNFCGGSRQRDWGTYVWDSERDQILMWGGGHCVAGASTVAHYSPVSGRMVEGYDADESYSGFGRGLYDTTLMNRPWIAGHNYNHYAYDPVSKMLLANRGYLYDPDRMDWHRTPLPSAPFRWVWDRNLAETTAHGVVTWAQTPRGSGYGLWLFDPVKKQWVDLKPKGKVRAMYVDADGACYDSTRDRFLMGFGGSDGKRRGNPRPSRISFFDFKTRAIEDLKPENTEIAVMGGVREMVYVPDADIVLFGSRPYTVGSGKKGRTLTHIYDCAKNRYMLLDAGGVTYGHSSGWMYDAKRKNVYAIHCRGQCWALHVDPKTLKLLDKAPES